MDKDKLFQYKYADYIKDYENATLLNMGYLDAGLYTTTGIVPSNKFFEVQNIQYEKFPDNIDKMKEYVVNKEVTFILYYTHIYTDLNKLYENEKYIFDNYDLIYNDYQMFERTKFCAYLFKVKD